MAILKILDADGNPQYMMVSGSGTSGDPFISNTQIDNNVPQQSLVYKSLTLNGASPVTAINRNMAVDGSTTPQLFKVGPPAGQIWQLTRMIFLMSDGAFDSGGWGDNGGTPLTNGVDVGLHIDGVDYDFTPVPWTTHSDLAGVAYDLSYNDFGQGDPFLQMRLTFSKAGQNIRLIGDDGDYLWMTINDDLTYLTEQRVMVQGYIEDVYL